MYICIIITVVSSSNERPKNYYHKEYVYDENVWVKFEIKIPSKALDVCNKKIEIKIVEIS